MTVKLGNEDIDLEGKSYVVLVHDGDTAEIIVNGERYKIAQLVDAAVRGLACDNKGS